MATDNKISIIISTADISSRVDIVITNHLADVSRAKVQKLIKHNYVKLIHNNIETTPSASYKVKAGDKLVVQPIELELELDLVATNIPIEVLYEDEQLLLVNKPCGLVVHSGAGNTTNTLVNALLYKYGNNLSNINGSFRPGIVHRLDKNTSGVLVIAKNDNCHNFLAQQFKEHSVVRNYRALIYGVPLKKSGEIKTFITRGSNRQKMETHSSKGKFAHTIYQVIATYSNYFSLVDVSLKTGRTHQIRVHMAYLGHSIVGDSLYGRKRTLNKLNPEIMALIKQLEHQALHAYRLGFIHPNQAYLCYEQAEPDDLQKLYSKLFPQYSALIQATNQTK